MDATTEESGIKIPQLDISKVMMTQDASNTVRLISTAAPGKAVSMANAAQAGLASQLNEAANAAAQASKDKYDATANQAVSDSIVSRMRDDQTRTAEVLGHKVADSAATADELISMNGEIKARDASLQQELQGLTARRQNGVFDNTLQWIYDQFALPVDAQAYNMKVDARNSLAASYDGAVERGTEGYKYIQDTAVKVSAEMLEQQAKSTIAKAQVEIAGAQEVAMKSNIPFLNLMMNLTSTAYSQRMQEAQYELSKRNSDLAAAASVISTKKDEAQLELTNLALTDAKVQDNILATISAKTGIQITREMFSKLPAATIGAITAVVHQSVSDTPIYSTYQAFENWKISGLPIADPKTRAAYNAGNIKLADITAQVNNIVNKQKFNSPEARQLEIEKQFNAWGARLGTDASASNIPGYATPSYGELDASKYAEGLKGIPLWGSFADQFAKNPATRQTPVNTTQLVEFAAQLLYSGKLTAEAAAAQVTTIGQTIVVHNAHTDTATLGLPTQSDLTVPVSEAPGKMFSGDVKGLKITDAPATLNYFRRLAVLKDEPNPISLNSIFGAMGDKK